MIASGIERGKKALLALRVFFHPHITLATTHSSGKVDGANVKDNIVDTILFNNAERSCYSNAPCGDIALTATVMEGMLELAKSYSHNVTEIVGGSHSKKSRHYRGVAFDVNDINGQHVSSTNRHVSGFMKECRRLGATEVLGPGDRGHATHVHAAWPRNSK